MITAFQTLVRWEPLAELPDHQLSTILVSSEGKHLVATAVYVDAAPIQSVRIDFGFVEAFKVYEEFSAPHILTTPPMMDHAILGRVPWPFQEVERSRWVRRVSARNGVLDDPPFRHFTIVTVDVILEVMTDSGFEAQRVPR